MNAGRPVFHRGGVARASATLTKIAQPGERIMLAKLPVPTKEWRALESVNVVIIVVEEIVS